MSADLRYVPKAKDLVEVVASPSLDSSREDKDILVRIIDEKLNPTEFIHEGGSINKEGKKKKDAKTDSD